MARGRGSRSVRWLKLPGKVVVSGVQPRAQVQLISALEESFRSWGLGTRIRVQAVGSIAAREDGVCALVLGDPNHMSDVPVNHREHAFTRLYTRSATQASVDEIVEADIVISSEVLAEIRNSDPVRLRALLLHEIGHFLGMDHPCAEFDATMQDPRRRPRCGDLNAKDLAMLPDPLDAIPLRLTPARIELRQVELLYGSHAKAP